MATAGPGTEAAEGAGETRNLLQSTDWSATSLGPITNWSPVLRMMVQGCLASSFPIVIHWGPERVALYNDAFGVLIGGKHPAAFGRPAKEIWPEAWERVGGRLDEVPEHNRTLHAEDEQQIRYRNGYPEECYFSYSHSPIAMWTVRRPASSPSPRRPPPRCSTSGGCGWSGNWVRCRSPTRQHRGDLPGRAGVLRRRGKRCRSRWRSCGGR